MDRALDVLIGGIERDVFSVGDGREARRPGSVLTGGEGYVEEVFERKERLAGLLPGVARWSHGALYGLPNEIVEVSPNSILR